jgi:hypothetical protein
MSARVDLHFIYIKFNNNLYNLYNFIFINFFNLKNKNNLFNLFFYQL